MDFRMPSLTSLIVITSARAANSMSFFRVPRFGRETMVAIRCRVRAVAVSPRMPIAASSLSA
jgi:hypothetical protein